MSPQQRRTDKTTRQHGLNKAVSRQKMLFVLAGLYEQDTGMDALIHEAARSVVDVCSVEYFPIPELLQVGEGTIAVGVRSQKILLWQADYILLGTKPVLVKDPRDQTHFEECSHLSEHVATSNATVKMWALGGRFGVLGAHLPGRRIFTDEENSWFIVAVHMLGEAISRAAQSVAPCGHRSGFRWDSESSVKRNPHATADHGNSAGSSHGGFD